MKLHHCIALLFFASSAVDAGASTRELLEKEVLCESCNAQLFVNWPGFDMLFAPMNVDSEQACCDACKARYGCRVWMLNRDTMECTLKEDVGFPIPCSTCVGGILDGDPYPELNACRAMGRACANRAAQGACEEVRLMCRAPLPRDEIIQYPPELPKVKEFKTKERREICKFYIRETCKWTAEEAAKEIDSECYSIALEHGPAESVMGCESRHQAENVFGSLVEAICNSSV